MLVLPLSPACPLLPLLPWPLPYPTSRRPSSPLPPPLLLAALFWPPGCAPNRLLRARPARGHPAPRKTRAKRSRPPSFPRLNGAGPQVAARPPARSLGSAARPPPGPVRVRDAAAAAATAPALAALREAAAAPPLPAEALQFQRPGTRRVAHVQHGVRDVAAAGVVDEVEAGAGLGAAAVDRHVDVW